MSVTNTSKFSFSKKTSAFYRKFGLIYHALSSTASVYYVALNTISTLSEENFTKWASLGFLHHKLTLKTAKSIDFTTPFNKNLESGEVLISIGYSLGIALTGFLEHPKNILSQVFIRIFRISVFIFAFTFKKL